MVLQSFAATVSTRLSRPSIALGESAYLQFRVENAGQVTGQPTFQAPPNLNIQLNSQQIERSNVNGRFSSTLVLTYAITPAVAGSYTIPSMTVVADGATLVSEPLKLTVTAEASNEAAPAIAFMKLSATKTNVYVGEVVPIEIRFYAPIIDDVPSLNLKSDGFTIGPQGQSISSRDQIGNTMYNVATLPMTVAAAKAGQLALGPAEAQVIIRIPNERRRGGDIFDEMFNRMQRRQVALKSDTVTMNVSPLPSQNVPPSFNGAIGNFQVTVTASPTNVAVGDPISLQIQVRGRGSFDTVKVPDFGWKDFTFYPPNAGTTNLDGLGVNAIKHFDQVITPQRAGITAIPPIAFSFFNPEQRAYRTIELPAIPITVRATGLGQAQPTVVAEATAPAQNQKPATDIVHIKPSLGQLSVLGPPMAARPWFLILQLLPIGLWGGAVAWRKRAEKLANDPRVRREREVARYVSETLPQLRNDAAKNQNEAFFATAFRLLQEQIGERLDLPAAAITEAVIDERLPKLGAGADLLATLRDLFQACNQARYARVTVAKMEALIPKIETALGEIQKLPPVPGGSK